MKFGTIAVAAMVALAGGVGAASAADPFTLSSSSFKSGTLMDKKYAGNISSNPNCIGQNVSPQLSWKNAPAGTNSYVMIMIDPEGRAGLGVDHWIAYGIPASVTSFAEGETSKASDKFVGGVGTAKLNVYAGPCTPPNTSPHQYVFIMLATDLDPKALPAGLTKADVLPKLEGHVKATSTIVGLFQKPN
ncbi:MAG: YbhB/YbcL family Raf kinase inhibitor-like protein [Pseudolabrys sp.]|nr:YbhB/YbcL family Raf kinase inhibitor-like protein [Pseudolabrys sp.]